MQDVNRELHEAEESPHMDLSLLDQRTTGTHDRLHQQASAAARAPRQPRSSTVAGLSGSPMTPPAAAASVALAGSTGAHACLLQQGSA